MRYRNYLISTLLFVLVPFGRFLGVPARQHTKGQHLPTFLRQVERRILQPNDRNQRIFKESTKNAYIPRGGSVKEERLPWGMPSNLAHEFGTNRTEHQQQKLSEKSMNHKNSTTTAISNKKKIPSWKASLPERLRNKNSQTLQKLYISNNIEIYIIGTAHVSNDSSAEVQLLLSHVQPDCIFLELCNARMALLGGNKSVEKITSCPDDTIKLNTWKYRLQQWWDRRNSNSNKHAGSTNDIPGTSGGNNWFHTMSTVLLTSVQEDYASQLGVELGGEFRCAHTYWYNQQQQQQQKQQPQQKQINENQSTMIQQQGVIGQQQQQQRKVPHLILGDRPVQITLIRAWESLSLLARIKVCIGLLWSSLPWGKPSTEELRNWLSSVMQNDGSDILCQSLEELRHSFPTLYTTIIAERDAWLAAKLLQTSQALQMQQLNEQQQQQPSSDKKQRRTIVAVVGAGHVPGIVQWLTKGTTTETPEQILSKLVSTKRWANDNMIQQVMIPSWINDVVEVQQ